MSVNPAASASSTAKPRRGKPHLRAVPDLDAEQHAKFLAAAASLPTNTEVVMKSVADQRYDAAVLTQAGWTVTPPAHVSDVFVPERDYTGENPVVSLPVPPKKVGHARRNGPATSKAAGKGVREIHEIRTGTQTGKQLLAYLDTSRTAPGRGLTAMEAAQVARLYTGCPWHRVTDLHQAGLVAVLKNSAGHRVERRNTTGKMAYVLVLTDRGRAVAHQLNRLRSNGDTRTAVPVSAASKTPKKRGGAAVNTARRTPGSRTAANIRAAVTGQGSFTSSADHMAGQKKRRR